MVNIDRQGTNLDRKITTNESPHIVVDCSIENDDEVEDSSLQPSESKIYLKRQTEKMPLSFPKKKISMLRGESEISENIVINTGENSSRWLRQSSRISVDLREQSSIVEDIMRNESSKLHLD